MTFCIDSFWRWDSCVWDKPSPVLLLHTFTCPKEDMLPTFRDFPHRRLFQRRLCCLVLLWYLKGSCLAADIRSADGGSFSGESHAWTVSRSPTGRLQTQSPASSGSHQHQGRRSMEWASRRHLTLHLLQDAS